MVVLCFSTQEFSVGHWELRDPSQDLLFLLTVSFASQNAAGHKLAWDIGRSWTLTDSRAWLRNKQAVKRGWRIASKKIRVAFGSGAKMHPCSRHTAMATRALCLPPGPLTGWSDSTKESFKHLGIHYWPWHLWCGGKTTISTWTRQFCLFRHPVFCLVTCKWLESCLNAHTTSAEHPWPIHPGAPVCHAGHLWSPVTNQQHLLGVQTHPHHLWLTSSHRKEGCYLPPCVLMGPS